MARRLAAEFAECRRSSAALGSSSIAVPSPVGGEALRIRTRLGRAPGAVLPPFVLIHGYGVSSTYWLPAAARLSRHADVYVPELPGHGLSDHARRPLTVPELAESLLSWIGRQDLPDPVLVGHSLGCQIAAEAAVRSPRHAGALVLIGPTIDPRAPGLTRQFARLVAAAPFERKSLAWWLLQDYSRAGLRVLMDEARHMTAHGMEGALSRVRMPVLVIRGRRDSIAPQRWCERVARLAGAAPPLAIERWSHAVHYGDPDLIAGLLVEFARTHLRHTGW